MGYYYIIYSFISSGLILLLSVCPFKVVNLSRLNYIPLSFIIFISLSFLSISGLPPFLGFYSKLLVIYYMVYFNSFLFCGSFNRFFNKFILLFKNFFQFICIIIV